MHMLFNLFLVIVFVPLRLHTVNENGFSFNYYFIFKFYIVLTHVHLVKIYNMLHRNYTRAIKKNYTILLFMTICKRQTKYFS